MADNNQELVEAKKLLLELNQLRDKLGKSKMTFLDENLLKIAKDLPDDIKSARRELEGMSDSMSGLYGSLRGITSEFKGQTTILNKVRGAFRQLEDIAQDLKFDEQEINELNASQLKKLEQKFKRNQQILGQEARALTNQNDYAKVLSTQVENLQQQGKTQDEINNYVSGFLSNTKGLSDEQKALLQLYYDQANTVDEINKKISDRIQKEKEINNALGVGGAAVQGISSVMSSLGMSSGIFSDAVQEAEEAMRNAAKDGGSSLQVLMTGLGPLAKGFGKALTDPLTVLQFISAELLKGSQNMADFRKQTGMGYWQAYGMNMEMKGIAAASGDSFITSEKLNKSFAMMTEHLGMSADILGGTALVSATNLEQRLGMSADNAAQLTTYTRLQGKDTEQILSNSVATVGAFNKQNKTAINARQVLNDVAGASKSMYLNMGKNVTAMAAAATKARALGLSLAQVEKIQESMLNFEDSIGKEMEANLLLGGGVNLAKAREYALTGDTAKLTEEIGKQESIRNAFATKNVIAQQAAADALGISKEELAEMSLAQDLIKLSAEDFKERYGEATYESMKSRSATEKFGDALDKVKDLLGSIIQVFSPIIDLAALLLDNPIAPWFMAAFIAAKVLGGGISGIGKAFTGMYNLGKNALTGLGSLFKKGGLASAAGALKGNIMGGAKAAIPTPAPGGAGGGGMMGGMSSINTTALLKGAAAMAIAAVGIFIFAKAIQELEKVKDWKNIAIGLGAFAVTMGVLGAVGNVAGPGLTALGAALSAFGAAMMTGFGAVGLAALTIAAIGLGFALNLAAPGIEAFGTVVTAVFAGIASVIPVIVSGFVTLISTVAQSIGPLLLLGPALLGIAAGLGLLGTASLISFPGILLAALAMNTMIVPLTLLNAAASTGVLPILATTLMQIAATAPELLGVAASLFGIAAGLGAIALAGVMAIPAIGGLLTLSVAAPALVSLGIGGGESKSAGEAKGKSEEGSTAALEKKLDVLIAAVKAGGNVYMDSNKVGRAQVLGSFKSA